MTTTNVLLGTQGWNYPAWVGPFYPTGTRAVDMLARLADRVDDRSLEIDAFEKLGADDIGAVDARALVVRQLIVRPAQHVRRDVDIAEAEQVAGEFGSIDLDLLAPEFPRQRARDQRDVIGAVGRQRIAPVDDVNQRADELTQACFAAQAFA